MKRTAHAHASACGARDGTGNTATLASHFHPSPCSSPCSAASSTAATRISSLSRSRSRLLFRFRFLFLPFPRPKPNVPTPPKSLDPAPPLFAPFIPETTFRQNGPSSPRRSLHPRPAAPRRKKGEIVRFDTAKSPRENDALRNSPEFNTNSAPLPEPPHDPLSLDVEMRVFLENGLPWMSLFSTTAPF